MPTMKKGTNFINHLLIFFIYGLRPLLGPASCRYQVGCTQFAVLQLQKKPLLSALWHISKRLFFCNPFVKPKN